METKNDGGYETNRESLPGTAVTTIDTPTQLKGESHLDSQPRTRHPLITKFLRWVFPEQRKTSRRTLPDLVAFLGSVRTSHAYDVGDISGSGFFMVTRERWGPGTEMPVTLLKTGNNGKETMITLGSTVVRCGPDGVGFAFLLDAHMAQKLEEFLEGLEVSATDEPDLMRAS